MTFQTIVNPIHWLFLFHAIAGAIALLFFLIPLFSKKGGKTHVRTGWIYTLAMIFVSASAYVITPWRALFDPERTPTTIGFAVFLFFIATFTLCALWYGLMVLRHKQRKESSRDLILVAPPSLLIVFSVMTQVTGITLKEPLLIIFPIIGIKNAYGQLKYWTNPPRTKMHWWYAHMNGMFTACIATVTAFLVTALPRLWPNPITQSIWLWIAPGIIMGTILSRWISTYEKKFGDA